MKNKIIYLLPLIIFVLGFSQTPISLETAFDKAFKNNMLLKNGELKVQFQEKMKGSAVAIDPLNVSGEIGQVNSAYVDNKISVNQSFRLPKFYNAQKKVLLEEWKNSVLNLHLQKWQMKRELSLVYNELNYINEKQKYLKKADSIFSAYFKRANLRLNKGESNILEKATAENLRSQAELQLNSLGKDKKIAIQKLSFLIGDGVLYENENLPFQILNLENINQDYQENPLIMKQLEQEKNIENAKLLAEKSKLSPSISLGINSMTIRGIGADEKYYNGAHRFQSGFVGVSIPAFNSAQKSVIEAQKINQQIAENKYQQGRISLKNQYLQHLTQFHQLYEEVEYYKKTGLDNSKKIIKTADDQLYNGEINFLEWALLLNQALEIQNKYIDKLKELNDTIIELNALKTE